MQARETSFEAGLRDDLTQVQLQVAQRADELMRSHRGDPAGRDFWHEAETEVWLARVDALAMSA